MKNLLLLLMIFFLSCDTSTKVGDHSEDSNHRKGIATVTIVNDTEKSAEFYLHEISYDSTGTEVLIPAFHKALMPRTIPKSKLLTFEVPYKKDGYVFKVNGFESQGQLFGKADNDFKVSDLIKPK